MPFEIKALVAKKIILSELAHKFESGRVADLVGDLGLLPLTDAFEQELGPDIAYPFEGLRLSAGVAGLAAEESVTGPVAYIEAFYGGGKSLQASVIYVDGRIDKGPLIDDTVWDPREAGLQDRPVDQALRAVGIVAEPESDEWDAAGLSRHRHTDDWK
jgi:hypothetical protein